MVCLKQAAKVSVKLLLKVGLGKRMKQTEEQVKAWKLAADAHQKAKGKCEHKEAACQE